MFDRLTLWRLHRHFVMMQHRDWHAIPIQECGEPLVRVLQTLDHPYYAKVLKLTTNTHLYLRERVYLAIQQARVRLREQGYDLAVLDGWRPRELQESIFFYHLREIVADRYLLHLHELDLEGVRSVFGRLAPTFREALVEATSHYACLPSEDTTAPDLHATGGTVAVWLMELGQRADLGVPFDWHQEQAEPFYHLKRLRLRDRFENDSLVQRNRTRLLLAMRRAGFVPGRKIWEFTMGTQMAALATGGVARYGYIEPE